VGHHFGMLLIDDAMDFTKSIRLCLVLLLLTRRNCGRLCLKGSQTSNCSAAIEFFTLGYRVTGHSTVESRGNLRNFLLTPRCKTGDSSNFTLPPHKNP